MAKNPRRRQQRLERKAAKRKEKKKVVARHESAGIMDVLALSETFPILHTWLTKDLWTQGMGWALFSRALPSGQVAFAMFLVDRYCLGVKNVAVDVGHRVSYDEQVIRKMTKDFDVEAVTPAKFRKFIESAVAYADDLGFAPHADYDKAKLLFGKVDPSECTEEFEFGKDGKPLFINGPNDSPARCRQILAILEDRCGEGGYHFMLGGPAGMRILGDGELDYFEDDGDEEEDDSED